MFVRVLALGALCMMSGCVQPAEIRGTLGFSDSRRLVVVGENVRPEIAHFYKKEYGALAWYTAYKGNVATVTNNFFESGIGPSRDMRLLIGDLKSTSYTVGRWEFIIPKIGEGYFLAALRYMEPGALSKARGMVIMIDSSGSPEMEREVERVSQGSFFVTYEFRKDVNQ